jgi:hypothetical protein
MKSSNKRPAGGMPNLSLAFLLSASVCSAFAICGEAAEGSKKNIFAGPEGASGPGFKKAGDNPAALQDRAIPDIRLVIALPSLETLQRKQIQNLYKESEVRLAGLRTEVNNTRTRMQKMAQTSRQDNDGNSSATIPNVVALTAGQNSSGESSGSGTERSDSQNSPDQNSMVEGLMEQSPQDLSAHAKELQSQIRNGRQNLWNQVKPLLTDQQMDDLDKMRRGQFIPQTTESAK